MTEAEWEELDKVLAELSDCDLGAWDQDFVDDMIKAITRYGTRAQVSPLQEEQIERMKGKYL